MKPKQCFLWMYELNHSIVNLLNSECTHCDHFLNTICGGSTKKIIIYFLKYKNTKKLCTSLFPIYNPFEDVFIYVSCFRIWI